MARTSSGRRACSGLTWRPKSGPWWPSRGRLPGSSSTGRLTRCSRTGFRARLQTLVVPGQRVKVPLGRGNTPSVGYCVEVGPDRSRSTPSRVKDILEVLDDPAFDRPSSMLDLTRWISKLLRLHLGSGARRRRFPPGSRSRPGTRVWTCLDIARGPTRNGNCSMGRSGSTAKQAEIRRRSWRAADVPLTIADVCKRAEDGVGAGPLASGSRGLLHTVKRRIGSQQF